MSCSEVDYSVWHKYMEQGKAAYQVGKYAEAERIFSLAIKEAEKFGAYDGRLLESLRVFADFYAGRGEASISRSLNQRALRIALSTLGPDNVLVVELEARCNVVQPRPKVDAGPSTLVWC